MRRLSMKAKKGKAEVSDSESAHPDEEQGNGDSNVAASEGDSAASEDAKVVSKRKNKRGKKKGNNAVDADDEATDTKKKKPNADEEEEESAETEEYEVESVVDVKQIRGKRQFRIRWKGYGPDNDTWENEDDLNCPEAIKSFLEKNENKDDIKNENKVKKRGGKGANKSPKKKMKTTAGQNEVSAGDDNKEYEVEKVMEVHFKKNGAREFLIHWKGFSHKEDTWEPESNLNCPDLIEKFMAKVDKAKSADARELRANPQHTDRFTLNMTQAGRRLSRRNQGKQR
ncbi:chromobox protein homolog 1-like isoform X2 [Periplaneta americana]